jgi:predicted MPP superfamily phosphohydrolase
MRISVDRRENPDVKHRSHRSVSDLDHHREPNRLVRLLLSSMRRLLISPLGGWLVGLSKRLFSPVKENWVDIERVNLVLPRLEPDFDGYRIVQISDFHIGTWLTGPQLLEAVELANQLEPDLVAITGDFVTYNPEKYAADLVGALGCLRPKDATVAVLGNHDHWTDAGIIRRILHEAGVNELSNRAIAVRRGGSCLWIGGVDCHYDGLDRLDAVLENLSQPGAAVLLAHEPDFAEISAASGRFDLQLSGHSHGGQIRLPIIGAPYLPRFGRKFPTGLYQVGGMRLYTNRGLGTAELAVRLNCRPEITLFTLEAPVTDRTKE